MAEAGPVTDQEMITVLEEIIRDSKTAAAPRIAAIRQLRELRADGSAPSPAAPEEDVDPFAALDRGDEVAARRSARGGYRST